MEQPEKEESQMRGERILDSARKVKEGAEYVVDKDAEQPRLEITPGQLDKAKLENSLRDEKRLKTLAIEYWWANDEYKKSYEDKIHEAVQKEKPLEVFETTAVIQQHEDSLIRKAAALIDLARRLGYEVKIGGMKKVRGGEQIDLNIHKKES